MHQARLPSLLVTRRERPNDAGELFRDDDDAVQGISSDLQCMEVESAGHDDNAVEVAALVAKAARRVTTSDRASPSTLCPRSRSWLYASRCLTKGGSLIESTVSGQISSLITTSTSLRMVGYYLRTVLAHRLKLTSQKCYKRLARETLGIKSPTDIATYPALYELVHHHYPDLASDTVEAWPRESDFHGRHRVDRVEALPTHARPTHHRHRASAIQGRDGTDAGLEAARVGGGLRRRRAWTGRARAAATFTCQRAEPRRRNEM